MFLTLGSIFLDVGALAVFGLAISLLVGHTSSLVGATPGWISERLFGLIGAGESRSMFFLLIGAAALLQLIKSGMGLGVIAVDAIFRANIQKRQVLTVSERVLNALLGAIRSDHSRHLTTRLMDISVFAAYCKRALLALLPCLFILVHR